MRKIDKKTQIKIFNIILIVIWMIGIFIFSGQQGTESSDTSKGFTAIVIRILTGKNIEANDSIVETLQLFIRKFAHFTIYTIGGFLIMNYAYTTDKIMKQKIIYSISFGGGYAITDELHQFFVPGRSAKILDVGIDTTGVITGVLIYILLMKFIKILKNKRKNKV